MGGKQGSRFLARQDIPDDFHMIPVGDHHVDARLQGQPGGVATLGPDGKVPGEQLPDIGGFYEVEEAVPPASRKANTLYGLILADYTGTGGEG
mgnify:CR=1 FL=1